jgi:hypothetical protein
VKLLAAVLAPVEPTELVEPLAFLEPVKPLEAVLAPVEPPELVEPLAVLEPMEHLAILAPVEAFVAVSVRFFLYLRHISQQQLFQFLGSS